VSIEIQEGKIHLGDAIAIIAIRTHGRLRSSETL